MQERNLILRAVPLGEYARVLPHLEPCSVGALQILVGRAAGERERGRSRLSVAGIIDYQRGHVFIRQRAGLEAAACDCYGIVRWNLERLLGRSGDARVGSDPAT